MQEISDPLFLAPQQKFPTHQTDDATAVSPEMASVTATGIARRFGTQQGVVFSVFSLEGVRRFMAVTYQHPDYAIMLPKWERVRCVLAGEDAVKAAGKTYLPILEGQDEEEYKAYKTRAVFFNATARTLTGYLGMVFRKPPYIVLPEPKAAGFSDGGLQ